MYKHILEESGDLSCRDLERAQDAFSAGARATFKVLGYLLEHGETEQLERYITRQATQVKNLQGMAPRKRRH